MRIGELNPSKELMRLPASPDTIRYVERNTGIAPVTTVWKTVVYLSTLVTLGQ